MAGGDRVAVDEPRARAAAAALEGLRDTLHAQAPAILAAVSQLRALGAQVAGPGSLQALAGHAAADAAQMRAAADLAEWMQRLRPHVAGALGTMVSLDAGWDGPGLAEAAARADATALARAAANPAAARAVITTVALDMADHQGDTSYLKAFWSAPGVGAAVTGLAGTLNHEDGKGTTLLSAADGKLLATFATSLAATVSRPGLLSGQASHQLVTAFAAPHDLWSASMLVKYGPAGTAYGTSAGGTGPKLLSGLTEALLTARAHQGYQIPGYASAQPMAYIPAATYGDVQQILSEWDPLTVAMQRATQNGTAAAQVLSGYNPVTGKYSQQQGTGWAHQLMDPPKVSFAAQVKPMYEGTGAITVKIQRPFPTLFGPQYPPPQGPTFGNVFAYINVPDSTRAALLYAATADHTSTASAQAVLNILAASTQIKSSTVLSQPIRDSLLKIARNRVFDFAFTSNWTSGSASPTVVTEGGMPLAVTNQNELKAFLHHAFESPADAGSYLGFVQGAIRIAVPMQVASHHYWVYDMGSLAGLVQSVINDYTFQGAEKEAELKAQLQTVVSLALPFGLMVPTKAPNVIGDLFKPGAAAYWKPVIIKLAGLEGSQAGIDYGLAGGDPAKALELGDQAFVSDKTAAQIMVVQGLIDAGKITPDPSFYRNGHLVIGQAYYELFTGSKTYAGHTLAWWVQQARDGMLVQQ